MPTPSLLIVPARFKTGKLYSQIPTSGAGDFTVTRNTEARRFDSAGLVASVASGIPRLDYYTSGGVTGCPALLVEPAATNLHTESEAFASNYSLVDLTASGTNLTAPDNSATADRYFETTANDTHVLAIGGVGGFPITSGLVYTTSVFVKAIGGRNFRIIVTVGGASENVLYTLSGSGSVSTPSIAKIESYGNDWYRCSLTFTATSSVDFRQNLYSVSGTTNNFPGDPSKGIILWGAQLETGSVATSYIRTTAGTGSRSADVISVSGAVSGAIGQTEGTIYCELVASNFGAEKMLFQIDNGTETQRVAAFYGSSGNITFATASGSQYLLSSGSVLSLGTHKVALTYSSGNLTAYVNGAFYVSGTPTHFPSAALNNISLGSRINAGVYGIFLNDRIRAVALYTTRLTNAELATLTTP